MLNLPNFTPLNVLLLWISAVSLSWFFYSFFELRRVHKKMRNVKTSEEKKWRELELKAQKDYQEILETANKKAEQIIQNATKVSFDISTSLKQTVDKTLSEHKNALDSTSLTLTNKYAGELEEINKYNLKLLTNVYKDIELTSKSKFEEYQKILELQTFEAEKQAKQKIEEEYAKLQNELSRAREQKLAELDGRIKNLVQNISKDIIGHSLAPSDQELLINQALDQAKKEGVI